MRPRHKETGPGARSVGAPALVLTLGVLAACGGAGPTAPEAPAEADAARTGLRAAPPPAPREAPAPSEVLDAELARRPALAVAPFLSSPDPAERRIAVRAIGRRGGDDAAQMVAPLLRDEDPRVREEACFAVGVTGSRLAAGILGPILESGPSPAEVSAAALGLGSCADDAAAALLVRLACRDEMPVEAPEAMFRHVRSRTAPWAGPLPDARLLRYEEHAEPRGRAGVGWFGRIWRDAALLDPLVRLSADPVADVRRAAAMGLADSRGAEPRRPRAEADRAVEALSAMAADPEASVVVAACRSLGSYEREDAAAVLLAGLGHPSFHVRTVAAEGLGARKSAPAYEALERLAREDASPSVRGAAAAALAEIDPQRAQAVVDALLASPSDYVRSAGAQLLARSEQDAATARLVALARDDPHVRVRETALDSLKGRKTEAVHTLVRATIGGDDPVLVSVAAGVAAANAWREMLPDLRAAFAKHPGAVGADAREGIATALGEFGAGEDQDLLRATALDDTEPGPRMAATEAIAKAGIRAGRPDAPAPAADRRPRAEGAAMPLGAPRLERDVDLVVETDQGTMRIRLDASEAPLHAAHLADLARKGFYDGLSWHRVVPDFVIQGGCPRGDGSGNGGVSLPLEPTRTPFERGTLGMPRSAHPDTGGCQLFVCHSRAVHLDVVYSAIGRVVEGLDVIDRIDVGSKIVRIRVVEPK